ncbi:MAG TPA: lipopolysaccharide heptosyltransferase I [Pyrinomonadaceae bacterium]|jgi:lipopolysaccharide heptosyltransferase I
MKILIVKLGSIGDIVHTLPALAAIRRAIPHAEISWVVENRAAEILRPGRNQFLSHLIEVDTKALRHQESLGETLLIARQQLRGLRASAFDIALDFQGLLKSAAIAKLAKAKRRYGFAREALREPASRFLLTDTVSVPRKIHVIRKNLALVEKALKIPVPEKDFQFPIFTEKTHVEEAAKIISRAGGNFAVLNPAGGWVTKLWEAEKFGALADKLWEENRLVSIVTTAPSENALAEKVLKNSKSGKTVAANLSLKGFYELTKRARVYVGGDTGPTHLAVAAKAPVVGIFGPTEWWRNGSPNESDICVERADIDCRVDCHRRTCGNWICMDISVEAVFNAVQKRLKSGK